MLFEIKKPRHKPKLLYFKQHFDTKEVILKKVFVLFVQNEYFLHDLHVMMLPSELPICVLYRYLLPDLHLMILFNELPICVLYQYLLPDLHLMILFNELPICVLYVSICCLIYI